MLKNIVESPLSDSNLDILEKCSNTNFSSTTKNFVLFYYKNVKNLWKYNTGHSKLPSLNVHEPSFEGSFHS